MGCDLYFTGTPPDEHRKELAEIAELKADNKRLREACEAFNRRYAVASESRQFFEDVWLKVEAALSPQPSLTESLEALRAAGGDAWDKVEDAEGCLGRKNDTQTGAS
jgi:hypothetical protein